jgi:hypothetical protein
MSIDTTFAPRGPTVLVGAAAIQVVNAAGNVASGITSFRVHNVNAAKQQLGWGTTSTNAVATAAAAGAPQNVITIEIGGTIYLELPYNTFFIASAAASFEVTPGMGGVGG